MAVLQASGQLILQLGKAFYNSGNTLTDGWVAYVVISQFRQALKRPFQAGLQSRQYLEFLLEQGALLFEQRRHSAIPVNLAISTIGLVCCFSEVATTSTGSPGCCSSRAVSLISVVNGIFIGVSISKSTSPPVAASSTRDPNRRTPASCPKARVTSLRITCCCC